MATSASDMEEVKELPLAGFRAVIKGSHQSNTPDRRRSNRKKPRATRLSWFTVGITIDHKNNR